MKFMMIQEKKKPLVFAHNTVLDHREPMQD